MNTNDRQLDIINIISQLDITPTMYKNAVNKYNSIVKYIENNGIEADMYPQGSFALGTVVRPSVKDPNASYDLDFICQIRTTRNDLTAEDLREKVENILTSSDLYGGKLSIYEECFTIEYAEINNVGFSIDIVPAADENEANKGRLRTKSKNPGLIDTAIAIPKHSEKKYDWITNNPKGYRTWFDDINAPFKAANRVHYRQMLYEANQSLYNSVEEIPEGLERSVVQRVIQILKYHRDMFYSKYKNGDNIKPISAIISTIVARIASSASPYLSVYGFLEYVLNEFSTYAERQYLTEERFIELYHDKNVIKREDGDWIIENPANPEDNLADHWNEDNNIPKYFFIWTKAVRTDLIDSLSMNDEDFRVSAENAFGQIIVENAWGGKYKKVEPKTVMPSIQAKPWRII